MVGKALSGELSCMLTGLISDFTLKGYCTVFFTFSRNTSN